MSGVSSRKPFELVVQLERPDKKRLKGGREVFLERGCRRKMEIERSYLSRGDGECRGVTKRDGKFEEWKRRRGERGGGE